MDVEARPTHVPFSGKFLNRFRKFGFAALMIAGLMSGTLSVARAAVDNRPIHASADREVWDRKKNRVELYGHAMVRQPGESLSADTILLDREQRTLDAYGNCFYVASDVIIYAEEMHLNLDSRAGTIIRGRVSNERFTLGGERINKLSATRFQTHWGEYSTCRDCSQSWSIQAEDVDLEIEGYAHLSNVSVRIKDSPAAWLPYLIVPIKSQRQSGLLFPSFSVTSKKGAAIILPFFWAINRSADMTFGVGQYSKKGPKLEWEGRYALSPRSQGRAGFYFLSDREFADPTKTRPTLNPDGSRARWALDIAQTQELPFGIEQKLRLTEVSDDYYPIYIGDVPGEGEMVLPSVLSFSHSSSYLSAYIAARRYRNLLNVNPDPVLGIRRFDPTTVQALPTALVTTNDRFLFRLPGGAPVATGLTVGVNNFTRAAGPFDQDVFGTEGNRFEPGIIREATRVSLVPSLYTNMRPWDAFLLRPSLRYIGNFYSFKNVIPNLYRSYFLFQTDLSAQLERVFDTGNPDRPRMKHLIRPLLTYSYIPERGIRSDSSHPFVRQIDYAQSQPKPTLGYAFDNQDIMPLDAPAGNSTQYYVPLGNSLAYGITTQLIERQGKSDSSDATYVTPMEFSAGQAINFRELGRANPRPFTRFFSGLNLNLNGQVDSKTTYYYYPYISGIRHQIKTEASYILERSIHQRILTFDRSFTLGYSWNQVGCQSGCTEGYSNLVGTMNYSLSDYVLPSLSVSYDFVMHRPLGAWGKLVFQSPSQCWRFAVNGFYTVTEGPGWGVDLAINLTGAGFGGVTEMVNQVVAPK